MLFIFACSDDGLYEALGPRSVTKQRSEASTTGGVVPGGLGGCHDQSGSRKVGLGCFGNTGDHGAVRCWLSQCSWLTKGCLDRFRSFLDD